MVVASAVPESCPRLLPPAVHTVLAMVETYTDILVDNGTKLDDVTEAPPFLFALV